MTKFWYKEWLVELLKKKKRDKEKNERATKKGNESKRKKESKEKVFSKKNEKKRKGIIKRKKERGLEQRNWGYKNEGKRKIE